MQGLWNLIGKVGQGPGKDFQYEIGEKVNGIEGKSVWTIHKGKKKGSGDAVTVFACDAKVSAPDEFHLAKSALKRLRSLRHPNILKFLDGFESDAFVYVVTEPVVPLLGFLESNQDDPQQLLNLIAWGLHQVSVGVSFLVNDCNLTHGNVNIYSVFVDEGGEWKLSGIEYCTQAGSDPVAKLVALTCYDPPEGRTHHQKNPKWACDSWGLGCLIWEVFNKPLSKSSDLKSIGKFPKNILQLYCELVSANPKSRKNPQEFIRSCCSAGGFMGNDFVKANLFLQEVQIKEVDEQKKFFESLDKSLDTFPKKFCVNKMLPQLLSAFEFGAAGTSVLGPLFKVGCLLDEADYQKRIVPCVVKLFSSSDRATRIRLLQQIHLFIQHVQPSIVNDQIFPNIATGFGDTVPAMREHTVKAMLHIVPKLSEKTMSNNLMRYFAKLQMDEQAGIRTNTTICLGKIAPHLPDNIRQRVLAPAFVRAVRDPFPHARSAGILAMASCHEFFSLADISNKLLPSLCALCLDPEKDVRDNTFRVMKAFLGKLESESNNPGSTARTQDDSSSAESSTWTGWAVTSFASRFYNQKQAASSRQQQNGSKETQAANKEEKALPSDKTQSPSVDTTTSAQATPLDASGDDDGSDYNDAWSDDQWNEKQDDDDVIASMRSDLMSVKEDLLGYNAAASTKIDDGDSDQSDYGDWGAGDWGDNDPVAVDTVAKAPSPVKQSGGKQDSKSMSEMLGMDTNDSSDFFAAIEGQPATNSPTPAVKNSSGSSSTKTTKLSNARQSKTSTAPEPSDSKGWEGDGDEWSGTGWDDSQAADGAATDRKAELMRKREERRQQREEANRERKAKASSGGAMKLGAVKKIGKGD